MPKYVDVLTIEQALIKAGNGHSFQIRALIMMGLQFIVAGILNIAVTELFFYKPRYLCLDESLNEYMCNEQEYCIQSDAGIVDKSHLAVGSVIGFFDLACNKGTIIFVLMTSYYVGGSMGSLYYAEQMEIRQGRYTVMIETLLLMGITCCTSIMSPSPYILSVALFASNFFQRGFFNSSMILFFEISSENLQKVGPPILLACWGLGELLGPYLIALFSMEWQQTMLLLVGAPAVLLSVLIKFMKESPRILNNRGKFDDAKYVLNYIAIVNGRQLPADWILDDEVQITELKAKMAQIITQTSKFQVNDTNQEDIHQQSKAYNFSSIFRYNSTRVRMLCLLYLYIVLVLGQFLTASEIQRYSRMDNQKTYIFLGLIETTGFLVSAYATLNYQRKVVIKCILIVAAFFHLLIAILPLMSLNKNASEILNLYEKLVYTIIMMVLVMCRMTLSFGFGFINVYALEVFPTSLRHYGFSALVFLTEFLFIFEDTYVQFCVALGLNSSIGMLLMLLLGMLTMQKLRETYDQPLKENVEEMQENLLNNVYIA